MFKIPFSFVLFLTTKGGFGPYQFLTLFLLLILEVPTAFVTFIPIFVGRVPELWSCGNETYSIQDVCGCPINESSSRVPQGNDFLIEESIIVQVSFIILTSVE
jgi:hypothetical protein